MGKIISFKNPANGYIEYVSIPFLWCLLFGGFYLIYKGAWAHALISLLLSVLTFGISWLFYPFFARGIVEQSYFRRGWIPVYDNKIDYVKNVEKYKP